MADVAPRDDQRAFVPALAAKWLLLSTWEGVWRSRAVYADDTVVGHLMWGVDKADGSHWLGGVVVDGAEQRVGVGRAAIEIAVAALRSLPDHRELRLTVDPANAVAYALYIELGFEPTGAKEGDEDVLALAPP